MNFSIIYKYSVFAFFVNLLLNFDLKSQIVDESLKFIHIEGGFFRPGNKTGAADERHGKILYISSFYISETEITNARYAEFLNGAGNQIVEHVPYINLNGKWREQKCRIYEEDSIFKVEEGYENFPVAYVCYYGAVAYCNFYNYRLPTEAEWEFAAKARKIETRTSQNQVEIDSIAWYKSNSDFKIHAVGLKQRVNGLYDIFGNMAEWCSDFYLENSYRKSKRINPKGPKKGDFKVHRGGAWIDLPDACNSENRRAANPAEHNSTIGFRVVK